MTDPFAMTAEETRAFLQECTIPTSLPREDVEHRLRSFEPWRYRLLFSNGADTGSMERMAGPWVENIHEKIVMIWPWIASFLRPGFSVLDVGCGPAHHAFSLRALGSGSYTGIEHVERNVQIAHTVLECAGRLDSTDRVIQSDAARTAVDAKYDLVLCLAALNNMDDVYGALRTMRDAMGPRSVLVLENLVTERLQQRGAYLLFVPDGYMGDHSMRWIPTLEGLEGLLKHFGFRQIDHRLRWANAQAIGHGMAKVITIVRF
jgi:SAM-dependent methyltransferase